MDELIAFITARLDDDEQIAWAMPGPSREHREAVGNRDYLTPVDPARVLADVAAKRAIVELHYIIERKVIWIDADGDEWQNHQPVCVLCVEKYSTVKVPDDLGPCRTVRLLASVYADHPDYREEWRP